MVMPGHKKRGVHTQRTMEAQKIKRRKEEEHQLGIKHTVER